MIACYIIIYALACLVIILGNQVRVLHSVVRIRETQSRNTDICLNQNYSAIRHLKRANEDLNETSAKLRDALEIYAERINWHASEDQYGDEEADDTFCGYSPETGLDHGYALAKEVLREV